MKRTESATSSRCNSSASGGPLSPFETMEVIIGGEVEESTEEQSTNLCVEGPPATSQKTSSISSIAISTPTTSSSSAVPSATPSTSSGRKRKRTDLDERLGVAVESMTDFLKSRQQPHSCRDSFANYVATELGELSKEKEQRAKRKIIEILLAAAEDSDEG